MSTFLEQVTTVFDNRVGSDKFVVADSKEYPGTGCAHVDVSLAGAFLRINKDRNTDFWIDFASPTEPGKFYHLLKLLVLVTGQPIERSRVMVGHSISDIGEVLRTLMASYEAVVVSLTPERWPETKRRLEDIYKQTMHPVLRDALERAKNKK